MEIKPPLTDNGAADCNDCGHFGTSHCATRNAATACDAFLPWSVAWQHEIEAIKRAQRAIYIVAGVIAILSAIVFMAPNLFD